MVLPFYIGGKVNCKVVELLLSYKITDTSLGFTYICTG